MIKSLKTIVISLAILIFILVSIILITLYSRFSSSMKKSNNVNEVEFIKINQNYDILSFDVENEYLYIHLKSIENEKIKIINLNQFDEIKDIYLK